MNFLLTAAVFVSSCAAAMTVVLACAAVSRSVALHREFADRPARAVHRQWP